MVVIIEVSNTKSSRGNREWVGGDGPDDYQEGKFLWDKLYSLFCYYEDPWCLGGNFNITVRTTNIEHVGLLELPLSNGQHTWSSLSNEHSLSITP